MSLAEQFESTYRSTPVIFRAPGRVNLIGEHTDYNDGFVMPAAIDLETRVAVAPREDRQVVLCSQTVGDAPLRFDLDALPERGQGQWTDYFLGVAVMLRERGVDLRGVDVMISSTVPLGSGLSSSAALEVGAAHALLHVAGRQTSALEIARLCQQAENRFVGVPCGIMDQYASALGQAGHALLIDCRDLTAEPVPIPSGVQVVICNSQVRHALGNGEYAARRRECEQGVAVLKTWHPHIRALRDVEMWQLDEHRADLDPVVYRRCRHVIGENDRVAAAVDALRAGHDELFGALLCASHDSLRDDYEVSCRELDVLVELALEVDGVLGSRMTGGGFGGCTVSLVRDEAVAHFSAYIQREYRKACGREPWIHACRLSAGAGALGRL
ncbi:MAG: galactokinase [Proteobacteria bacterium]|nr:galactokinase [Pseudomonadota bacterium]